MRRIYPAAWPPPHLFHGSRRSRGRLFPEAADDLLARTCSRNQELDGYGVFGRALLVLRRVILERQELHFHIGGGITIKDTFDPAGFTVERLKRPAGQFAELLPREILGWHDAMLQVVQAEVIDLDQIFFH